MTEDSQEKKKAAISYSKTSWEILLTERSGSGLERFMDRDPAYPGRMDLVNIRSDPITCMYEKLNYPFIKGKLLLYK